jgi:4-hydroxy-3-polyprenylbenzoate decarboxylase
MVSYAATAPLPAGVNELIFAGFLRRSGVEMVKCKTVDLEVPAHSEIILEGFVSPDEYRREGPFGDHTGYYSLADNYPVFQLTAMTMKKKAVYQSTVVGIPPMEDCYLGHATERLFLPMLQQLAPEVIDHHLPWVSGFHNCHILSFEKEYPYQSRKLMSQIWGLSQAGFCKCVITCSKDAPIHDGEQFLNYFLDHLDLKNSLFLSEGILDVLDHSSNIPCFGSKLGIDISHRIEGEAGFTSPGSKKAPIQIKLDWLDKELAAFEPRVMGVHVYGLDRRHSLMFIRMNKHKWKSNAASLAARVFEKLSFKMFSLFVMIDEKTKDIRDYTQILRRIFHNVDPKRDLYFDEEGRIFIDASYKMPADGFSREWPPDIEMTEDIVKKVDKRLNKAE